LYLKRTVRDCLDGRHSDLTKPPVGQLQNDPDFLEWAKHKMELDEDSRRNELENERAQWSAFVSAAFQQQPKPGENLEFPVQPSHCDTHHMNVLSINKAAKDHSSSSLATLRARPGPRALIKHEDILVMQGTSQEKEPIPPGKLRVECILGSYQGTEWMLTPVAVKSKTKKDVKIGRSNSKSTKDYGICLSEDTEVSTRHGTITVQGTTFFYHDAGSTNGSYVLPNDIDPISPQEKVEITNGLKIRVGQQVLQFTF
jgi:FHA domain